MLKRGINISLLLSVTILLAGQTKEQTSGKLMAAIEKWRNENPQEKIFLQSDKTHYMAGESILMKAWCLLENKPAFLSRIVYVDLVNDAGKVVKKKMYKMDSLGTATADIELPLSIEEGYYEVRAYTLWMLNYPDFIYRKSIFIHSTNKNNKGLSSLKEELYIQFFPEGGDLIEGVTSKVAFTILNQFGLPINTNGIIEDEQGNKITEFSTLHNGMGVFEITPSMTKKLTARLQNIPTSFPLPAVKPEGITLKINNTNINRMAVMVERGSLHSSAYNNLLLVATMDGQVVYLNEINFDAGETAASIPKKNLSPGIMQVTIFNLQGVPLAERLAFIANHTVKRPSIAVTNNSSAGKWQLKFDSLVASNVSILISNGSLSSLPSTEDNLAAAAYLTSDIKGYIHNPGYYFEDKSPERLQHLDLLLLTQGWRRFEWKKLMNNEFPLLRYPVESYLSIRGKATKSGQSTPLTSGRVSFLIKTEDSTNILADAILTDKGEFIVDKLDIHKKATLYYQGTDSKREKYIVDVKLYPEYIDTLQTASPAGKRNDDLTPLFKQYLQRELTALDSLDKKYKQLATVTVKGKKISKIDSLNNEYASPLFASGRSIDLTGKTAMNIWRLLQQEIPGLQVQGDFNNPNVYFNRFANTTLGGVPEELAGGNGDVRTEFLNGLQVNKNGLAFYLNEVNVSQDVIDNINIDDIALVKSMTIEAAPLGASNGAIAIYTKKGVAIASAIYDKTFSRVEKTGYAVERKFYSPPVATAGVDKNSFYTTLLWMGTVKLNSGNTVVLELDKSQTPDKIKVVIQGIDKTGTINLVEKIIDLSRN